MSILAFTGTLQRRLMKGIVPGVEASCRYLLAKEVQPEELSLLNERFSVPYFLRYVMQCCSVRCEVCERLLRFLAVLLVGLGLSGCFCQNYEVPSGYPLPVDNVYSNPQYQHSDILNVLLLPLDNPMDIEDFDLHHDEMVLAILRGFGKAHYFNLHYDPRYDETAGRVMDLETGMIDRVKLGAIGEEYNSQAVLKISVNDLRTFPPMRIKVKAALIDTETGERIWAFDHVFDADDANVINAMKLWWNSNIAGGDVKRNRFDLATLRPSFFMKFVFHSMVRSYVQERVENEKSIQRLIDEQTAWESCCSETYSEECGCCENYCE